MNVLIAHHEQGDGGVGPELMQLVELQPVTQVTPVGLDLRVPLPLEVAHVGIGRLGLVAPVHPAGGPESLRHFLFAGKPDLVTLEHEASVLLNLRIDPGKRAVSVQRKTFLLKFDVLVTEQPEVRLPPGTVNHPFPLAELNGAPRKESQFRMLLNRLDIAPVAAALVVQQMKSGQRPLHGLHELHVLFRLDDPEVFEGSPGVLGKVEVVAQVIPVGERGLVQHAGRPGAGAETLDDTLQSLEFGDSTVDALVLKHLQASPS